MKNTLLLLGLVLTLAAFAGMMRIKTDVQTMDRERLKLVRERAGLRETKRVLEAEWALLASPARLEHLVRQRGYVAAAPTFVVPLAGPSFAPSPTVSPTLPRAVSLSAVLAEGLSPTLAVSPASVSPSGH